MAFCLESTAVWNQETPDLRVCAPFSIHYDRGTMSIVEEGCVLPIDELVVVPTPRGKRPKTEGPHKSVTERKIAP